MPLEKIREGAGAAMTRKPVELPFVSSSEALVEVCRAFEAPERFRPWHV